MGGMEFKRLRHRSNNPANNVVDNPPANTEALNSTHGIPSKRPVLRRLGAVAILFHQLTFAHQGVAMAQRSAQHEAQRGNELDTLRSRLSEEVSGIRNARRTDDFEKFATSLFKDLLLVNRMFGKSMPTPIPDMAGATNAEKIITMNKWLGLNAETQPPDTMMALSGRLVEIFNSTQQSQVAEAVSAQINPPEKTTEAPTTVAEVIPKPVTSPI